MNPESRKAVGFFDSGVGGLTALTAFHALMPEEDCIYLGDTARCPYGGKDAKTLKAMAEDNLRFFEQFPVKLIVAACGTMSANCREVFQKSPVPVINVLDSSLIALQKSPGPLGVLATEASIRSGAFVPEGYETRQLGCPEFVPLIERGIVDSDNPELRDAAERYCEEMKGCRTVLLGCTHYGLIQDAIRNVLGDATALICASDCVAKAAAEHLMRTGETGGTGRLSLYCTGDPEEFDRQTERILHAAGCGNHHAQRAWCGQ